jgi:hypothetical protein
VAIAGNVSHHRASCGQKLKWEIPDERKSEMKNRIVSLLAVMGLCLITGCGLGGDSSYDPIIASLEKQMKPLEGDKNHFTGNINNPMEYTPNAARYAALENAHDNLVKMRSGKVKINDRAIFGKTVLMMVCESGLADVAEFLIAKGADINAKDEYNATALIYAAAGGNAKITGLLLDHGADPNVRMMTDKTALGVAIENGQPECARSLEQHGAQK